MIDAKIICDSIGPNSIRLTTFSLTYPRFILAELNTHRMLSKSTESSRAVPVQRRIKGVAENPFTPAEFGRNARGMQAHESLEASEAQAAREAWESAARCSIGFAEILSELNVHKQHANRILEPFAHARTVVTATHWRNFFALRCHKDAQPEFQELASLMLRLYRTSRPSAMTMGEGEWHLPYVTQEEKVEFSEGKLIMASAARCARVSYGKHDGTHSDVMSDLARAAELLSSGHMSPFEHQAQATSMSSMFGNFQGWVQFRKTIPDEQCFARSGLDLSDIPL